MKNIFKSNKKGFTLVELLAVIVILALLIVITANTVLPMMNKAEKSGMVTYAGKVMSNAAAEVQSDELIGKALPGYYKVSVIMDQDDYVGCVKVTKSGSNYTYALKLYSTSDKYYIFAGTEVADNNNGTLDNNGTVKVSDLDKMTYSGDQVTSTTASATNGVEELCGKGADVDAMQDNWEAIGVPTAS